MRAAASSSASGRLSSRRQSSPIVSFGSKPRASAEELDRLRLGQRRHRVLDLAPDPEQLAAGDEQPEVRAAPRAARELGRGLDDLLEVVEQEQQLALADVLGEAVLGAERLRDRLGRRAPGRAARTEPTQKTPALNAGTSSAAASIASRVLPEPPGPVSVTQPRTVREHRDAARRAPARGRRTSDAGRGRFVFEIVFSGGNALARRAGRALPARAKSFSRCSPSSVSSPSTSARVAADIRPGRRGPAAAIRARHGARSRPT